MPRSARLSAKAGARQSLHIAQLLQEQTEEEAVYFSLRLVFCMTLDLLLGEDLLLV